MENLFFDTFDGNKIFYRKWNFEKDKKTRFEYNGEISQKIFDPLHGVIKLKIDKVNLNNSNIENMINNWKYHAL